MGLQESRVINSVHPWLGARLQWLGQVASLYGSAQSLLSGRRSNAEQLVLYNEQGKRPAAYPGCSQHNYGFAADAFWQPAFGVSSKGRALVYSQDETNRVMNNAARHASLTLVAGDTGHLQMYPGIQFREWAVAHRLCPLNPPPPVRSFVLQRTDQVFRLCGPDADSVRFGLFGTECLFEGDWLR